MSTVTAKEPVPVPLQLPQSSGLTPESWGIVASVDSIITVSDRPSTDHDAHHNGPEYHAISHVPQTQVPEIAFNDHGNDPAVDDDSVPNVPVTQTQSSGSPTGGQSSESSTQWKRKIKKALCGAALANICAVLGLITAVVWWVLGYKFSVWTARNDALQSCYNAMAAGNTSVYCTNLIASGVQKPPFDRRSFLKRDPDDLFIKHSLFISGVTTIILASLVAVWVWSRPRLRTPKRLCISMARGISGADASVGNNFVHLSWSVATVLTPPQEAVAPSHCQPQGPSSGDPGGKLTVQDLVPDFDFAAEFDDLRSISNRITYSDESLPLSAAGEAAECNQEAESINHTTEAVRDGSGDEMPQECLIRRDSSHGGTPTMLRPPFSKLSYPPLAEVLSPDFPDYRDASRRHTFARQARHLQLPGVKATQCALLAMGLGTPWFKPFTGRQCTHSIYTPYSLCSCSMWKGTPFFGLGTPFFGLEQENRAKLFPSE